MSTNYYAYTFWGVKIAHKKLFNRIERPKPCSCVLSLPLPKFCPSCGQKLTVIEHEPVMGYDGDAKFGNFDVKTRHSDTTAYVGKLLGEDSFEDPKYHTPKAPTSFWLAAVPTETSWRDSLGDAFSAAGLTPPQFSEFRLHTILEAR